ncbi:MAG: hypothetical protein GXP54_00150 [Deltaproteobacteria bacterium]|nr:hypothetical protein [Deltaproteobacteria bacterium]
MSLRPAALALFIAMASIGCSGGGGEATPDTKEDVPDIPDAADDGEAHDTGRQCSVDDDCKDMFDDLGQCETFFCDPSINGGECSRKPMADGAECDDGDPCTMNDTCSLGECSPGDECECRSDEDCVGGFGDIGQCRTRYCDKDVDGGTCATKPVEDGTQCDDEDACTKGDQCVSGQCVPGAVSQCDCHNDADCIAMDDGNKCNGTLVCDRQHFPYKCKTDPSSPVECDKGNDTFCRQNTCVAATGGCEMSPAHEGETCEDNDACTKVSACQSGACIPFELLDCDDGDVCTTDTCDPATGCAHAPVDGPCDDGDACTQGDSCSGGLCVGGPPVDCDNGVFCDGEETCDPATGCVAGAPPSCDDDIQCTIDACDATTDQCVHQLMDTALEGPLGSETCLDANDNDCDGATDADDPDCSFGITGVQPTQGPAAGGTQVTLAGGGLDTVKALFFGGLEVDFTIASPQSMILKTPSHQAGAVTITISNGPLTFDLTDAFLYTGQTDYPDITAIFVQPAAYTMTEGQTLSGVTADIDGNGSPLDTSTILVQAGFGPTDSLPWSGSDWTWTAMHQASADASKATFQADVTVELGGYLSMAVRFSMDGGTNFEYGDLDGSGNGYQPDQAASLTVWGVPEPGEIVINELMWMGSNSNNFDEWFELRNMTRAPFDLGGFKVSKAGPVGTTFDFEATPHVVHNLLLMPHGYFLVAEYEAADSALSVQPDIVGGNTMVLPNGGPVTYQLMAGDGTVIDTALFNGDAGVNGDGAQGEPDRSMERNLAPGTGLLDTDWHSATVHEGWDGDPFQVANWGTPRGPNSDISACQADVDCADSYPGIDISQCQRRVCDAKMFRCTIEDIEQGAACDDGWFCTDGDACLDGVCAGSPKDCSDGDKCTLDSCDEDLDLCVNPAKDCDDFNACTFDSCDPDSGNCVNAQKDCDDQKKCTMDGCDEVTGACFHEAVDCDDNDVCTADSCLAETGGCSHIALQCGDGDPCTLDSCDPELGCTHGEPIPGCTGCTGNQQCADDSMCTGDTCEQGICFHLPIDCDDGDPCTVDHCADLTGECWYLEKACDDKNPCTIDSCDPDSGECVFTLAPGKHEGSAGDPTCSDEIDNDCDDLTDQDDPQCRLALLTAKPAELPFGQQWAIALTGTGLDIVTGVLLDDQPSTDFTIVQPQYLTATFQGLATAGDHDVSVTDGTVVATLEKAVRVIAKATDIWANTQSPSDPITVIVGNSTAVISGQVFAAGITDADGDPGLIQAMIGFGPSESDPFTDEGWTWKTADWNPQCVSCGSTYEYTSTLAPQNPGEYIVGFRFSIDGGFHWAYGDLGAGSSDGWDPAAALGLIVTPTL